MQVIVDGLLVSYDKKGSGKKTILFLHGWGDSKETFSDLSSQLSDHYELLSLDLPGFGGSERPLEAWGLGDYAKFVHDWLVKIKAKSIHTVLGHSFGGSIAIVGLSSGEIKSENMILLASGGVRNKNFIKKKTLLIGAKIIKIPLAILPVAKSNALKAKSYKKMGSDLLTIPHMRQTFLKMVREDVQIPARSITQPVLLIYGDNDEDTPASYGRLLANAMPNSQLVVLNGLSHFLHQENPQKISQIIKDFLNEAA